MVEINLTMPVWFVFCVTSFEVFVKTVLLQYLCFDTTEFSYHKIMKWRIFIACH